MLTLKDYEILEAIIDRKDKFQGIIAKCGTTRTTIAEKTNLSSSKIHYSLQKFENLGLVAQGLKESNAKTYILTQKGIELLHQVKGFDKKERIGEDNE